MQWAKIGWVLAQAATPEQPLSSDLTWLRLPQGTQETITMFFVVMLAIVLSVIATLLIQGWVQKLLDKIPRAPRKQTDELWQRLEPELRAAVDLLMPAAGVKAPRGLLRDANLLEQAVARYVAQAPPQEDLSAFTHLRRRLGLTAMNPDTPMISTRQLLPDLTVRLMATIGTERLDLYCPLLEVSERFLLIDMPYEREIYSLLSLHPDVFLMYWRESDGETAFKVHLMPIHSGRISAFRCEHALRSGEAAARQDFRLTMDLPVSYQFLDRGSLALHQHGGKEVTPVRGEARLVDLSEGGAALLCDQPLADRGFAQLHFSLKDSSLKDRPLRVMMEVLTQTPAPNGKTLVRGHFRGTSPETRGLFHGFLTHEQFKRIQTREHLVISTKDAPQAEDSEPAPEPPGDTVAQPPPIPQAQDGPAAPDPGRTVADKPPARPQAPRPPPRKARGGKPETGKPSG